MFIHEPLNNNRVLKCIGTTLYQEHDIWYYVYTELNITSTIKTN